MAVGQLGWEGKGRPANANRASTLLPVSHPSTSRAVHPTGTLPTASGVPGGLSLPLILQYDCLCRNAPPPPPLSTSFFSRISQRPPFSPTARFVLAGIQHLISPHGNLSPGSPPPLDTLLTPPRFQGSKVPPVTVTRHIRAAFPPFAPPRLRSRQVYCIANVTISTRARKIYAISAPTLI